MLILQHSCPQCSLASSRGCVITFSVSAAELVHRLQVRYHLVPRVAQAFCDLMSVVHEPAFSFLEFIRRVYAQRALMGVAVYCAYVHTLLLIE